MKLVETSIIREKPDTEVTIKRMKRFKENLESTMDGISQFPFKTFNSGSYYDKTKVPIRFIQQAPFLPKFLS